MKVGTKNPLAYIHTNKGVLIHDFEHLIKSKDKMESIIDSYKKLDAQLCLFELVETGTFCYAKKLFKNQTSNPISVKNFITLLLKPIKT